ncbi:GAF and ANTAR domain-containing protein [Microbacterium panaciterrae]|uniref:GAF domain-containing protein n=1 Tax=Microbacterium panaciterrae TaxID=985759 RepID=A0ABP8P8Q3_9MICO
MVGLLTTDSTGGGRRSAAELCSLLLDQLPVTGVSISVVGRSGQFVIGASDLVAARLERLQFDLGEGPHWVASRTARPVLVPDLQDADHSGWPVFGAAAAASGAVALFAIPMVLGAVMIGVVDMYRASPGPLSTPEVARALALAALIGPAAMRLASQQGDESRPGDEHGPGIRREVHQATGMILAQLGTSATEAFVRLQAYAFAHAQSVEYVAGEVVARRLDFRNEAT